MRITEGEIIEFPNRETGKFNLIRDYDNRRKTGKKLTVDAIKADPEYAGGYALRVIGEWKRPRWVSLRYFFPAGADKIILPGVK